MRGSFSIFSCTCSLAQDRDRSNELPFGDGPLEPYVMPPRSVREMCPRARRALIGAQKKSDKKKMKEASELKPRLFPSTKPTRKLVRKGQNFVVTEALHITRKECFLKFLKSTCSLVSSLLTNLSYLWS